jgi:hypothetical protein
VRDLVPSDLSLSKAAQMALHAIGGKDFAQLTEVAPVIGDDRKL